MGKSVKKFDKDTGKKTPKSTDKKGGAKYGY